MEIEEAKEFMIESFAKVIGDLVEEELSREVAEKSLVKMLEKWYPDTRFHVEYNPKTACLDITYAPPVDLGYITITIGKGDDGQEEAS